MMRSHVYHAVVNAISSTQMASGRSANISGSTRPLRDLSGFDSLNVVEATCEFAASLGKEISSDMSLFVDSTTHQPRTVDEIVDAVCEIIQI